MTGYSNLASLMGAYPETAVFRRFGTLNAQNLLYYQAELTHLELRLKRIAKADAESGHQDRTIYDRDWQTLSESEQVPGGNPEQWRAVLDIRRTLKEYSKLILKAETPNSQDLKFLKIWMKDPKMGNVYLLGSDSDIWEKPDMADIVVLRRRENQSPISRILSDSFLHWYHHRFGWRFRKPKSSTIHANTVEYSQQTVLQISALIGTICASVLPVVATVVLYYVSSMAARLAIIGAFTVLFSAALGLLTNGRVIEIFSATAAFAAVQVVFVGTTSNQEYPIHIQ
ncbi:hypothetical protein CC78DRAFT_606858 [Lojkania enalia]|uniref:DUF6594 domain-containing protein n=1 Tax=Lojkania enalia TaxID=147567 RepID=A0A9P4N9B7_9PLEO|nr:hypothetical protein CC78DRAFT_606858 [Didymosphaeria enalia]